MKLEDLKREWSADEIRLMVKVSALEILQRVKTPPGTEEEVLKMIDDMTEDEIYERAYESYISCNN